ncbi:MAG TPA: hypothetical protein VGD42_04300, partial [Lysobacter sp.]
MSHITVIPAKAGIHFDLAAAAAAAAAVAIALARHSREGGNPGTFHASLVASKSKEESLAKLPIACGARVTLLLLAQSPTGFPSVKSNQKKGPSICPNQSHDRKASRRVRDSFSPR